ncbi:MAG: uL15m family ribosomal protein [archaeon]
MQTKRTKKSRFRAAKDTAGYGSKKKHRGSGNKGGYGNSGSGKRGLSKYMKVTGGVNPLGKHGFKSLNKKVKVINLSQLEKQINSFVEKGKAKKTGDSYEIDLSAIGYDKLLSKGNLSIKLNITAKAATENAIERVKKAGGTLVLK